MLYFPSCYDIHVFHVHYLTEAFDQEHKTGEWAGQSRSGPITTVTQGQLASFIDKNRLHFI